MNSIGEGNKKEENKRGKVLKSAEKSDEKTSEKRKKMNVLIFLVVVLIIYDLLTVFAYFYVTGLQVAKSYSTDNIKVEGNGSTIVFDSLSLQQKLAQMMLVSGTRNSEDITRMNVGGIYVFQEGKDKIYYTKTIKKFKNAAKIKPFFSTDLEGYLNPFKQFYRSQTLSNITNTQASENLGREHGKLLQEMGFTINFAPVAEADGKVWPGRGWNGSAFQIAENVNAYLNGLQSFGIIGVVKHYPGGSIENKDPHKGIVEKEIRGGELFPFLAAFKKARGVMVGHVVVSGDVDSKSKPCSVSPECLESIRNEGFNGLIITDEINMKGLSNFYAVKEEMYVDLINAGNDVILDFKLTPRSLDRLLKWLENTIKAGRISEKKIDEAVTRILKAKGYVVV